MKSWSSGPVVWGGVSIAALLLALAVAVILVTRHVEEDAISIGSDSVPGLAVATRIRLLYIEEFGTLVETADRGASAVDALRNLARACDAQSNEAVAAYRPTILIDPQQDLRLVAKVAAARRSYTAARDRWISALASPDGDTRRAALDAMSEKFRALNAACETLVAYNTGTGTRFAKHMASLGSFLREVVFGLILLVAVAAFFVGFGIQRQLRAVRQTRQSMEMLAIAFRVSPHSMVISRLDDAMIIAANDAFRRQYGLENQDLTGYTSMDVGVWRSPEERAEAVAEFRRAGHLSNYVKKSTASDGRELTYLLSAERIVLDGKECLLTVGQNVTDRIRAEEALARSESELRTIVEHAGVGVALLDVEGHPIRANPALERFLGYSAAELREMTFRQFTHPEDVVRDVGLFAKLVSGELSSYRIEKRYLRKDGATVWGNLTVSFVPAEREHGSYVIGMVEDITEQKVAEIALRESEAARRNLQEQLIFAQKLEALGQLAGGVAHDFNNILAAIMLHLDVIKLESALSPAMQESLDELMKSTRRASGLTRQLLMFSRREPVQRQVVDLNVVVGQLLKMLVRLVGRQYTLDHAHDSAALWLNADPGMLEQVVMNLIVNARDAMPRGGRIAITTDAVELDPAAARRYRDGQAGRYVRLVVADRGCGMSDAVKAKIFEPFFTTKEAGKGTGLGLSTVFGIVRQHGGWLHVDSTEGQGATFTIGFPAHGHGPQPAPAAVRLSVSSAGHETILVAEDNEAVRMITTRVLREAGYRVVEADNGADALALLHRGDSIDLLLSDVVMPGGVMGGELAAAVRERGRPKVILMSAYAAEIDIDALSEAGVVFLSKPFNTEQLLQSVRATLEAPNGVRST